MLRSSALGLLVAIAILACSSGDISSESKIFAHNDDSLNIELLDSTWLVRFELKDELFSSGYVNLYGDTIVPAGKYMSCYTDTIKYFGAVIDTSIKRAFTAIDKNGAFLFQIYPYDNGPDYIVEGMFRIVKNDLIGFANEKGKIVLDPKFQGAFPFHNGLARVTNNATKGTDGEHSWWISDEWFHINKKGDKSGLSYLALGDSYTIGESVEPTERFPVQLARSLQSKHMPINDPMIIARTGWRTDDMLKAAQNELAFAHKFDLVTLLIGVNNEYQGWEAEKFRPEFEKCLTYATAKCKTGTKGLFVVSIPDYGYSPLGSKNQEKISPRLDEYNKICKEICSANNVTFFNVTDISRSKKSDVVMIADDGLHPSAAQYQMWVDSFSDEIFKRFNP